MARDGAVLNKLAWRAKWRARFKAWKKFITIAVILIIGVPSVLVFTPWLPKRYEEGILKFKFQEGSDTNIRHEAAEQMYKLGCFYSYTMREAEGAECFLKICKWHYGYDVKQWCIDRKKAERERLRALRDIKRKKMRDGKVFKGPPYILEDRTKVIVGKALFKYGEFHNRMHKQWTNQIYVQYVDEFGNDKNAEPTFTNRANIFISRYRGSK